MKSAASVMFAVAVALLSILSGCGSGSTSSEFTTGGFSSSASVKDPRSENSGSRFFSFGIEAPPSERDAATRVLERNLRAREKADFGAQCGTLSRAMVEEIAGSPKVLSPKEGSTLDAACPKVLKALAEPLKNSKRLRADNLVGPLAALRIQGPKAYALYRGIDKKVYVMPMTKEAGRWRVGALLNKEAE